MQHSRIAVTQRPSHVERSAKILDKADNASWRIAPQRRPSRISQSKKANAKSPRKCLTFSRTAGKLLIYYGHGDPSRIRTCNPRSRNPLLYPVELWDRRRPYTTANMKNPLPGAAVPNHFAVHKSVPGRGPRWLWSRFAPCWPSSASAKGWFDYGACDFFASPFRRHEPVTFYGLAMG
jgi:hypothetical protein